MSVIYRGFTAKELDFLIDYVARNVIVDIQNSNVLGDQCVSLFSKLGLELTFVPKPSAVFFSGDHYEDEELHTDSSFFL